MKTALEHNHSIGTTTSFSDASSAVSSTSKPARKPNIGLPQNGTDGVPTVIDGGSANAVPEIVGGVIGGIAGVGLLLGAVVFVLKLKNKGGSASVAPALAGNATPANNSTGDENEELNQSSVPADVEVVLHAAVQTRPKTPLHTLPHDQQLYLARMSAERAAAADNDEPTAATTADVAGAAGIEVIAIQRPIVPSIRASVALLEPSVDTASNQRVTAPT